MKALLAAATLLIGALAAPHAQAGDYQTNFADTTLRIDFAFSGACDGSAPTIAFSELSKYKGWGGRRVNLTHALSKGAADVTMTDPATGDTLYINPFNTLFQEWLVSGDESGVRTMEGTVLLPYPRKKVDVTINLRDNRRQTVASSTLKVDPLDILIADHTSRLPQPHSYLYRGENPDTAKISVAILGEGFTAEEMPKFMDKAREAVDAILDHEPFASMADSFDFIAVETPSRDSGVSVPRTGLWLDTPFGSHFSTFYSDRYLTTPHVHDLYDAITSTPAQHLIVLANTDEYGGGGIYNFYTLTTAGNEAFHPVVVHEFGHSFGALADEYYYEGEMDNTYPLDIEPWEPNITTKVDFNQKWQNLIDEGRSGLIEGAGYRAKGIFRGNEDCRMRTNTAQAFCPVCQQAIREQILWLTKP